VSESEQLCTFLIGEYRCALPVQSVLEVLAQQQLAPVPLAPPVVAGLLNLRGQILTVLDLRRIIIDPTESLAPEPMTIVLDRQGQPVALLVDAIGDVLRCERDQLLESPETIDPRLREGTMAIIHQEDVITLVLDPVAIIHVGEDLSRSFVVGCA